jgi:hypothetical protein
MFRKLCKYWYMYPNMDSVPYSTALAGPFSRKRLEITLINALIHDELSERIKNV